MMKHIVSLCTALLFFFSGFAQKTATDKAWNANDFSGLKMRHIGPAFMSGRIADIAIHPSDESTWYVAVGSGGLWKTENSGISWNPVFDNQSVYSTGCVTLDPNNPSIVWLGTGENVGGRHVSYGDGIYRSTNGGKNWQNMGLKKSQHISKIIVHPSNSNIIMVAAQGPLWNSGGERGFYKSTDGGKSWKRTLGDDQWTGVTDIAIDPRNPDWVYAATWDRHRTVAAYMGGGPGSGIYRSTDGGESWEQMKEGLPASHLGKIGLAISPQNPDVLYAAIELNQREGGVYKSTDRGSTWSKQSSAVSGATGPHYYQELYASPHHENRIYLMDIRVQISDDGGKTFRQMKEEHKHSDNHAMAFRKSDPNYLLVGTDGGLYESFDLGQNWRFFGNLPLTQFYKIAVDDTEPFYQVYGGTQDNNTQVGPSRTDDGQGIQNGDWKVVLYGDGHQPATEPGNPDIVYTQWQQGNLTRVDMRSGEIVYIKPHAGEGEKHERTNWDAPILVSSHKANRIYHGTYRLWKSENRGDEWMAISGDLTRDQNRLELEIMGRKQSYDNPWDVYAMSTFNTITSIAESPHDENVLYVGTDDGLIHRTQDMGKTWNRIELGEIDGIPSSAYVNDLKVDLTDPNTIYAALDNHKEGDLKPYLIKSTNQGKSWVSLTAGLPDETIVWRLVQDPVNHKLMFIGTEFGIYFSLNAGGNWIQLKGGLPTISFRDLKIQEREGDLVAASFGRGIYIFDDLSVFRALTAENLQQEATLFPNRKAWWYFPRPDLDFGGGKGSQGEAHFVAENPPYGAVFTYFLKDGYPSAKDLRLKTEKALNDKNEDVPFPGYEVLDAEMSELPATIWLELSNDKGALVRRIQGQSTKGFHRIAWDLRHPSMNVIPAGMEQVGNRSGMLVAPGTYYVRLLKEDSSGMHALSEKYAFEVKPLYEQASLQNPLAHLRDSFWAAYENLANQRSAFNRKRNTVDKQIKSLRVSAALVKQSDSAIAADCRSLRTAFAQFENLLEGSPTKNKIGEKTDPTLGDRMWHLSAIIGRSAYGPTPQAMHLAALIQKELSRLEEQLSQFERDARALNARIMQAGGPAVEGLE